MDGHATARYSIQQIILFFYLTGMFDIKRFLRIYFRPRDTMTPDMVPREVANPATAGHWLPINIVHKHCGRVISCG